MNLSYVAVKGFRKIFGKPAIDKSVLGQHTKVDVFSTLVGSTLGDYSYIGANSTVLYTRIGKFCSISNYCAIGGGEHPLSWVSTSPVFNSSKSILNFRIANISFNPFAETMIGNDVWIGSHCLIRAGIKISDGAVIGMGSVLTHDVGPYEIWAGNPAKMVKKRFTDEQIEKLVKMEWWKWSKEEIQKYSSKFNNVLAFLGEVDGQARDFV